jgi:hypothetical protein
MRTRFVITLTALLSLAAVLALSGCLMLTNPNTNVALANLGGSGGGDSTGTGGPPPPPSGLSIGVSGDSTAIAGSQAFLLLFVGNNDATADSVVYHFTGPQGWPGFPAAGALAVPGNGSNTATLPVAVPVGTAGGVYLFHFQVQKPSGAVLQSGDFGLTVHSS